MNLLAACSGPDSSVRKFVFKSSAHYYGCEQDDPAFFTESMGRPHPPRTAIERDIVEAEASVADFAEKNPDVAVAILRFANVLGPTVRTAHARLFSLPAVPMILGFDPRYQFAHEDDVVHSLEHAVTNNLPGVYNVAGDGVLALSEVAGLLGKTWAPVLPPWGTGLAATALRRIGLKIPPEMLKQLRFGRGVDNRRFKAAGFRYGFTSREAVEKLAEHLRLHPIARGAQEPYRYEREVEEFLRWSPHVKGARQRDQNVALSPRDMTQLQRLLSESAERPAPPAEPRPAPPPEPRPEPEPLRAPVDHYDDLEAEEIVTMLASLERGDLEALRDYERGHASRDGVLSAIDSVLARRPAPSRG
jgi:UDP-glucose 4-epimerase